MAKDPDGDVARPGRAMSKHLKALGLESAEDYIAWCRDAGFEPVLSKSPAERLDEADAMRRQESRTLARRRIHSNPRKFILQASAGEIAPDDIARPGWTEACAAIQATRDDPDYRRSLADFLIAVDRKAGFVFESTRSGARSLLYIDGLIRLHDRRGQWLRDVADWRPGTHNPGRQFSSLCRHLVCRYPVPAFLDNAWMRRDAGSYRYRDWYVHLAAGHNLRTAKTLFPMTRKEAHHFLDAPDGYTIEEALLWADVRALGGNRRLVEALLGTRLGDRLERGPERRRFWASVYRFLIANPLLDRRHAGPIVDYLAFQKFEEQEIMTGPGIVERRPPPQPNLSMARRTPDALLRQVDQWHGSLRDYRQAANRWFKPSGIKGFTLPAGKRDDGTPRGEWRIRELLSGAELIAEGRALRHCVASYAPSCAAGHCSIWTMEWQDAGGDIDKRLTLELDHRGTLIEVRGMQNRLAEPAEWRVIEAWVKSAGLAVGRYLS